MDHKWLEDFIALAREKSFSKAAELRHVTQPQFSRRIRSLEMWAGTDLVNRATVPLSLTAAGEELLAVARLSVSSLADIRSKLRHKSHTSGWLRLATGRTLSRTVVPAWYERMQCAVGAFQLKLLTGSIAEGVTALEQGASDFLLSYSHPRLPLLLDGDHFDSMTFGQEQLVAVCKPTSSGKPQHPLPGKAQHPVSWLSYSPTLALAQIVQDGLSLLAGKAHSPHLQAVVESDFAESLHEQALRGMGVAWLPRSLVHSDLQNKRLVLADAAVPAFGLEIRLFRLRHTGQSLVQRVWDATLKDHATS